MKYATPAAFRQALDDRLKSEAEKSGLGIARLRKCVAFELFLRSLVAVAPDRWVLKGALALDFRFHATSRPTRNMDLGRTDDENAANEDFAAAQELALDDFFTFAAQRTDALDDADDFRAIRFHITAELAGRVFDQFVVDVGFADSISSNPDTIETSLLDGRPGLLRYASSRIAVGIRPEDISLAAAGSPNTLSSVVEVIEALGSELLVHFSIDAARIDLVADSELAISGEGVARIDPCASVKPGERTTFAVDPMRMHFFDRDNGSAIWT